MTSCSPSSFSHFVRKSHPTPSRLYDVFWHFAFARHQVYTRRITGGLYPWTNDPVLSGYKFTNVFRAADRVSQNLIRILYSDPYVNPNTLVLRVLLFKIFNKIDTWDAVVRNMGIPAAPNFDYTLCERILDRLRSAGQPIYSAAYIMPTGGRRTGPKHKMHLNLIRKMVDDNLGDTLVECKNLSQVYNLLRSYPTLGPFLAYQYTIDLNYSVLINHSENDFVVPGPGALDGLSKCFETLGDYTPSETIRRITDLQDDEFSRLGLQFPGLWGRALHLIDIQNIFCEVSKYTRMSHPEIIGRSGRKRIKQKYKNSGPLQPPFFPPKWGISVPSFHHPDNDRSLTHSNSRHDQSSMLTFPPKGSRTASDRSN